MIRLILAAAVCALPLAAQTTVRSIFQEPATGRIAGLDVQGRLEIKLADSDVPARVPLDEVEEVNFGHSGDERKPESSPLRVYLINGDVLHGAPDNGPPEEDEYFVLRGERFGELQISVEAVRRIEYVPNVAPNVLPELESGARSDVTYFAAHGNSPAQADPASSLVRIVRDGVYLYNEFLDEDNFAGNRYAWSRIQGVVCFRTAPPSTDRLKGIFTLRDGSILKGEIRSWGEGRIVIQHRILRREITLNENNLISVSMKNGRYIYLSDMEFAEPPNERPYYLPADFNYEDYLFKVRRDSAQGGGPISLRGRVYAKGLGVHAISRLTFDLNRQYTRFLVDIGVDDSAGDLASVEFKVYADGKLIFESGVMRRSAPARSIDLEVLNARRLVLEVTAADNADIQDRANWANAKLVR
jgi:hypothetical protein